MKNKKTKLPSYFWVSGKGFKICTQSSPFIDIFVLEIQNRLRMGVSNFFAMCKRRRDYKEARKKRAARNGKLASSAVKGITSPLA